jgi:PTH1 family peptidyl-tRNA hydrolase
VVAITADRYGGVFKKARRGIRAQVADVRIGEARALLALPLTFMNESGQAVAPLVRYYGVALSDLLVVHDDIDLPFVKLRVQEGGGHGGNNGVRSTSQSLGSPHFWRLKFGVGRPPGSADPADFVLRRFATVERDAVSVALQVAADVVEVFVAEGGEVARQRAGELNQ